MPNHTRDPKPPRGVTHHQTSYYLMAKRVQIKLTVLYKTMNLVCTAPWMSTVVLCCLCHSDSASVLLYFTVRQ